MGKSRARRIGAVVGLAVMHVGIASAQAPRSGTGRPATTAASALSAADVSILFPAPKSRSDLAGSIRVSDLVSQRGTDHARPVWASEAFEAFKTIANGPAGAVAISNGARQIRLPATAQSLDDWFVAGIRIDHAAPGGSPQIIAELGQQPQVRLIVQPVGFSSSGAAQVEDVAAHLIFSFAKPQPLPPASIGCLPRGEPDQAAFNSVIRAVMALRDQLARGHFGGTKVVTAGKPLGVHPGLLGGARVAFAQGIKSSLEEVLTPERLQSLAVMGLANGGPEPWIFLSMAKLRAGTPLPGGGTAPTDMFVPVPNPVLNGADKAQMLSFLDSPKVQPNPTTNNLNPITCRHATFQAFPLGDRKGVSTAEIIAGDLPAADVRRIVDVVADPVKSHFFNTDCVSCHTETQLLFNRAGGPSAIPVRPIRGIVTAALPNHNWNVRNFGWFPNFFDGSVRATVTRRTANETAEVVDGINALILRDHIVAERTPPTTSTSTR